MGLLPRMRNYFVGHYLASDTDVFEQARVLMFYRFMLLFTLLFMLPIGGDIALGLMKGLVKHLVDLVMIIVLFFAILPRSRRIDNVINFFFVYGFLTYQAAFMIFNPMVLDTVSISWATLFFVLSVMLQRGAWRIFYCLFLGWVPIAYVALNIQLEGALTVEMLSETTMPPQPGLMFVLLILPIVLTIAAVWGYTSTIQHARRIMTEQKKIIEEKNCDILDSIHYAKRIQLSLLPSDKLFGKQMDKARNNQPAARRRS